mmetsp:Transcript_21908/g.26982  ORF Transcript_21908/g.26982 Transcript_21908/m.26982 type:complete len:125 (-) Transcript_21908:46-420(-)|eukprot:CAMPEP_0114672842 /NCGR_PEP_ID=MMETSP0191-20121206/43601_1 /TAXON_ID=126664 /ORGANISM="Sorites sp." /LENGTH=124 /DNA_ID=CAMNT_0001936167 /DNA_START=68 /DNA_END=442 /DNA_ORIENTATION=+
MKADLFFEEVSKMIGKSDVDEIPAVFQFEITGENGKSVWAIDTGNKKVIKGGVSEPSCTFIVGDEDFVKMLKKEADGTQLFMTGKLQIDGDMSIAMQLQSVLEAFDDEDNPDAQAMKKKLQSKL